MRVDARSWHRWRPWVVSLVISVAVFWYLLSQINPSDIGRVARQLAPRPIAAFLALLMTGVMARALRFRILLGGATSLRLLTLVTLARNLFVDLLPARLGELSYVYLLTKRVGRSVEDGLASLLLAFLFDLIALAPLLILAVLALGSNDLPTGWLALAAAALAAAAYGVIAMSAPVTHRIAVAIDSGATGTRRQRLAERLRALAGALDDAQKRHIVLPVLLVSVVVRVCKFGSFFFLVLAIMVPLGYTPADLGVFRVFLGLVAAEVAAALPIHGIAGFGTYEAVWALSFVQLGFSREHAIISGILTHAVSQVVEYLLGAAALLYLMRPTEGR